MDCRSFVVWQEIRKFVDVLLQRRRMARLMAIDFGRRRTGIAVTDPSCIIANPLETVATATLVDWVKAYTEREQVATIIVGYPRTVRGEDSESMRYLTPVINRLRKVVSPIPVEFFDERFTSVLAHRAMIDGGMKKSDRRDKSVVDKISASIILNDFLSSRSFATDSSIRQ